MASAERAASGRGGSPSARDTAFRLEPGSLALARRTWPTECVESSRIDARYTEIRRGIEQLLIAGRRRGSGAEPEELAALVSRYVRRAVATETAAVVNGVVARALLCAILEYERWPVHETPAPAADGRRRGRTRAARVVDATHVIHRGLALRLHE